MCRAIVALLVGCLIPLIAAGCQKATPTAPNGEQIYNQHCASCHGVNLEGIIGLPLDRATLAHRSHGTAEGLFQYIRQSMPQNAPRSLSDDQYYAVVGYLLTRQGLIPGQQPVTAESAGTIKLSR